MGQGNDVSKTDLNFPSSVGGLRSGAADISFYFLSLSLDGYSVSTGLLPSDKMIDEHYIIQRQKNTKVYTKYAL